MMHGELSATAIWLVLLLGAYHGLNPGMGWLFAVALGMQEQKPAIVARSLVPIASPGWDTEVFSHLAMTEHMQDFARGLIKETNVLEFEARLSGDCFHKIGNVSVRA